jgi:catechol-2,3-dioxygenase
MRTTDVASLERFYTGVVGLQVLRRDDARGTVWLDAGGTVLMLEPAIAGEPGVAPGTLELIAFDVDSIEAWRATHASSGINMEAETPHTLYFRDPDGRRVGVSDYRF